jgi:hypothetical protein
MTIEELETRIGALEHEVAELRKAMQAPRVKDWRRTVGMFAGDPVVCPVTAYETPPRVG